LAAEFGMSPASRGRVSTVGKTDEEDPLEKLLSAEYSDEVIV